MHRELHTQNYFENISNVNIYGKVAKPESLYVIIITSQKKDFDNETTQRIPLERYSEELKKWEMYKGRSIELILNEFSQNSKINISPYYLDNSLSESEELQVFAEIRKHKSKLVFVVDIFSILLCKDKKWFGEIDQNHRNDLGGILIPICENYSDEQVKFAKILARKHFPLLHKEWEESLKHSFSHAELDIPNKIHFLRRLANVAFYYKVSGKSKSLNSLIEDRLIEAEVELPRKRIDDLG